MADLFDPWEQRGVRFRNRIGVAPMCQYVSRDGFANDWHLVHLVSRAVGGAGLVITEATAVAPEGRITPGDLGIWSDRHMAPLDRVLHGLRDAGAVAGVQLAHAGRKASCAVPWEGGRPLTPAQGAWTPVAPSALPFEGAAPVPHALCLEEIAGVRHDFVHAGRRALTAGAQLLEVHAAHGYLLHSFLSPLSNRRQDAYGGSFENRIRLLAEVVGDLRTSVPESTPLWVRLSATDWVEGGWDLEQSVALARVLRTLGVDLVDCSSGGLLSGVAIPTGPGYQVPFSDRIRRDAGIATAAVGLIRTPAEAREILRADRADMVLLGREMLRDPYWPLRAARELGVTNQRIPDPYARAW